MAGSGNAAVSVRAQRAAVPGFWRSLIPDFSGVPALRAWVPPSARESDAIDLTTPIACTSKLHK